MLLFFYFERSPVIRLSRVPSARRRMLLGLVVGVAIVCLFQAPAYLRTVAKQTSPPEPAYESAIPAHRESDLRDGPFGGGPRLL